MFEKFKRLFLKDKDVQETNKPIIITIHGYGRRRKHEFDNLALWAKKDGYEVVQFDMYDIFDDTDCDWMHWIAKTKEVLNGYRERDIYLVGFSMGGVIASYLASMYPVKKLILLAPAFQYMNMDMITDVIVKSATSFMSNEKKEEVPIPRAFYGAFTDVIKNLKKYITQVNCPVFILHGDQDEVISVKSSLYAYDKIPHTRKKLLFLHGGHHRLLMDEGVNWECYQIMKLFFDGMLLGDEAIEQSDDIMGSLLTTYKEQQHKKNLVEEDKNKEI